MPEYNWFIVVGGEEKGPIATAKLKQLAAAGKIKPDRLIRRHDQERPVPARKIKGLLPDAVRKQASGAKPAKKALPVCFFVVESEGEHGPYELDGLRQLVDEGRLTPLSRLRNIELDYTNSARRVKGLFTAEELAAHPDPKRSAAAVTGDVVDPVDPVDPVEAEPETGTGKPEPQDEPPVEVASVAVEESIRSATATTADFAVAAIHADELPIGDREAEADDDDDDEYAVADVDDDVQNSSAVLSRPRTGRRDRRREEAVASVVGSGAHEAVEAGPDATGAGATAPADGEPVPSDAGTARYLVDMAIGEVGPYTVDQLRDFVDEGDIDADDEVRRENTGSFVKVRDLLALAPAGAAADEELGAEAPDPVDLEGDALPTATWQEPDDAAMDTTAETLTAGEPAEPPAAEATAPTWPAAETVDTTVEEDDAGSVGGAASPAGPPLDAIEEVVAAEGLDADAAAEAIEVGAAVEVPAPAEEDEPSPVEAAAPPSDAEAEPAPAEGAAVPAGTAAAVEDRESPAEPLAGPADPEAYDGADDGEAEPSPTATDVVDQASTGSAAEDRVSDGRPADAEAEVPPEPEAAGPVASEAADGPETVDEPVGQAATAEDEMADAGSDPAGTEPAETEARPGFFKRLFGGGSGRQSKRSASKGRRGARRTDGGRRRRSGQASPVADEPVVADAAVVDAGAVTVAAEAAEAAEEETAGTEQEGSHAAEGVARLGEPAARPSPGLVENAGDADEATADPAAADEATADPAAMEAAADPAAAEVRSPSADALEETVEPAQIAHDRPPEDVKLPAAEGESTDPVSADPTSAVQAAGSDARPGSDQESPVVAAARPLVTDRPPRQQLPADPAERWRSLDEEPVSADEPVRAELRQQMLAMSRPDLEAADRPAPGLLGRLGQGLEPDRKVSQAKALRGRVGNSSGLSQGSDGAVGEASGEVDETRGD